MSYISLGVIPFSGNSAVVLEALVEIDDREQNLAANTTAEHIFFHAYCTNGATFRLGAAGNVTIWYNGVQLYNGPWDYDYRAYVSRILADETRTVTHNSDGSKTVGWSISITDPQIGNASLAGSYALPTIPRATTPSLAYSTRDAGQTQTISLPRASPSFTHKIEYRFAGGAYTEIASAAGTSFGPWTIPESILTAIPTANSGTLTFRVTTYNGATQIGDPKTVNMTVNVPTAGVPDFTISSIEETVAALSTMMGATTGPFIQGKSIVKANLTSPTPYQGSTIDQIQVSVDGVSLTDGTDWSSGTRVETLGSVLPTAGTRTVTVTVWDKRGKTRTKTTSITVRGYTLPSATGVQINRTDVAGSLDDSGTYLTILAAKTAVSLPDAGAVEKNALYYRVDHKLRTSGSWTLGSVITPGGRTHSAPIGPTSGFSAANAYDVRLVLMDNTIPSGSRATVTTGVTIFTGFLSTEETEYDFNPDGLGVGKRREQGSIDAAGQIYQNNGKAVLDVDDFASSAETITGTSTTKAVTPDGLADLTSTTTRRGLIETATSAEDVAGTLTDRASTPAGVKAAIDARAASAVRLTKSSAQSTSGSPSTDTAVLFNTESIDTEGLHSTSSNTSRITAVRAGPHLVMARLRFNHASATSQVQIFKNGSALSESSDYDTGTASRHAYVNVQTIVDLAVGEYVEAFMRSSSASVPLIPGNCTFEAFWIGAA